MGEAQRKKTIREHEVATTLINRMRDEIAQVEPFNRENYECPPDTVIVRRDEDKTIGQGEIVIGKKERQQTGVVEVSGYDWLKPGDQVLFSKFGGMDIQLDDTKLVHLHRLQIYVRKRKKN